MQASQANIEMERRLTDYSETLITIKLLHQKAHMALLNKRHGEAMMCAVGIEANALVLKDYINQQMEKERAANPSILR